MLEETLTHLLQYTNKFEALDSEKLSKGVGMLVSIQTVSMSILSVLMKDHLVKEGLPRFIILFSECLIFCYLM